MTKNQILDAIIEHLDVTLEDDISFYKEYLSLMLDDYKYSKGKTAEYYWKFVENSQKIRKLENEVVSLKKHIDNLHREINETQCNN